MSSVLEKVKEQEFYQQIQGWYQQLPSEQQDYLKWGGIAGFLLLLIYIFYTGLHLANGTRTEYFEKQELARVVADATDEIRRLKGQTMGMSGAGDQNWKSILGNLASAQGLTPDSIEILKESPGASQAMIQESLLEVRIKNVSIDPLVRILTSIDHGSPPMKIKGMIIEPNPDSSLTAKLNLSGYLAKPEKAEKK